MARIRPSEERDRRAVRTLLGDTPDFDRQDPERRVIHTTEENGEVVGVLFAVAPAAHGLQRSKPTRGATMSPGGMRAGELASKAERV